MSERSNNDSGSAGGAAASHRKGKGPERRPVESPPGLLSGAHFVTRTSRSSFQAPANTVALAILRNIASWLNRRVPMSEILKLFRAQHIKKASDPYLKDKDVAFIILDSPSTTFRILKEIAQSWIDKFDPVRPRDALLTDTLQMRTAKSRRVKWNKRSEPSTCQDRAAVGPEEKYEDSGTKSPIRTQPSPTENADAKRSVTSRGSKGSRPGTMELRKRSRPTRPEEVLEDYGPVDPSFFDICGQDLNEEELGKASDGQEFTDGSLASRNLSALSLCSIKEVALHVQALRLGYLQDTMRPVLAKVMSKLSRLHPTPQFALEGLIAIKARLNSSGFMSLGAFAVDVDLIFDKCKSCTVEVTKSWATEQKDAFDADLSLQIQRLRQSWKRSFDHHCRHCRGFTCALCGEKCLPRLKSPVVSCHACAKRIPRGTDLYVERDGGRAWCPSCFMRLPEYPLTSDGKAIVRGGGTQSPPGEAGGRAGIVSGRSGGSGRYTTQTLNGEVTPAAAGAAASMAKKAHSLPPPPTAGAAALALAEHESADKAKGKAVVPAAENVMKRDLLKRKSADATNCAWVICDFCDRWMHTVCALFNLSENTQQGKTAFFCPMCRIRASIRNPKRRSPSVVNFRTPRSNFKRSMVGGTTSRVTEDEHDSAPIALIDEARIADVREAKGEGKARGAAAEALTGESVPPEAVVDITNMYRASSLPHTALSKFLEDRVRARLLELGEGAEARAISIRLLSNTDTAFDIPNVMSTAFTTKAGPTASPIANDLPKKIRYRGKTLAMFQRIGANDVYVLSMYTQEYGADAPYFNKYRAYVAYVDSVDYAQVKHRTAAYKEVLVGYLEWLRRRGFKFVHMWICRPKHGDSYIFWNRPRYQRIPDQGQLTKWYWDITKRAIELGVASKASSLCEMAPFGGLGSVQATDVSATPAGEKSVDRCLEMPALFDGDFLEQQATRLAKLLENRQESERLPQALANEVRRMGKNLLVVELEPPGTVWKASSRPTAEVNVIRVWRASHELKEMLGSGLEDPDPVMSRPLADKPDVFLKTCQLRHYQFDTLAHAKYSTAMMLYHLNKPNRETLHPRCAHCSLPLRLVRYLCPTCNLDRCLACGGGTDTSCKNGPLLIPDRPSPNG